jgi:hypothetical protein
MYSKDQHEKRNLVIEKINKYDSIISTQILNELYNFCIKKSKSDPLYLEAVINKLCRKNTLISVALDTVDLLCIFIKDVNFHFSPKILSFIGDARKFLLRSRKRNRELQIRLSMGRKPSRHYEVVL